MTNATDALRDALYNLHELTQCRCHDDYKSRGRIDPDCNHDYREDVDALQAEVARLSALVSARNMPNGATFEQYRAKLAVGGLTPLDQMAFDNMLHDSLEAMSAATNRMAAGREAAEAEAARLREALRLVEANTSRADWPEDIYTAIRAAMGSANGQG